MSDVNVIHTQIAKTGNAAAQASTGAQKGSGLFSSASGMAFWDMIFSQIGKNVAAPSPVVTAQTAKEQTIAKTPDAQSVDTTLEVSLQTPLAATDIEGLLPEDLELSLALDESLLALLGEETGESGEEKPMSLFDILALMQNKAPDESFKIKTGNDEVGTLKKQIDAYQKLIDQLTAGLPLESKDVGALEKFVTRLQKQTELLSTGKINGEEVPLQLFIALGMSPAQLTRIGEKIARLEEKLGREITVEDIVAGVGDVLGEIKKDDKKTASIGFGAAGIPATGPVMSAPAPETPAQKTSSPAPAAPLEFADDRARYQRTGDLPQVSAAIKTDAASGSNAPAKIAASAGPSFSAVLSAQASGGDVTLAPQWNILFADNITPSGFDIQTGLPITQAAQAAHAATSIAQAGQTHPATQLVMTTLNKMAKGGDTSEMTIQMDPPELGRVLAKLQFGKDKTVKAVLMVEKPETYTMLIRDAASLERALQNAGLTTDSASLSFELAQDGSAFNSDNNGQGGGEPSGKGGMNAANDSEEIIQTSMTWQVDSDTGYVRYSLLA